MLVLGRIINSSYVFLQLSVKFEKPEVKPGNGAMLWVEAEPRSVVFLLGVDKSVKLLGTGNDITRDKVSVHSDCAYYFIFLLTLSLELVTFSVQSFCLRANNQTCYN